MKVKKLILILLAMTLAFTLAFTGCGKKKDDGGSSGSGSDSGSSGGKVEAVIDGIEITKAPTKTTYIAGETFDKTGMEVSVHYSDGTLKPITSYYIDKTGALTVEDTYVTVTYSKYNVKQAITVKAPSLYSIDVESSDNAVYRYEAEKQDVSGWAYQSWNTNGFIMSDNQAVSGGQYLGNLSCDYNAQGRYNVVTVTVNSSVEAVGVFSFAYAGGAELSTATFRDGVVMKWNERAIAIPVDKKVQTTGWFDYETYEISGLPLNVGVNTFEMQIIGNCPNIDYFELEVNKDGVTLDESLFAVHYCESKCDICGKCTNADCDKEDCLDKCPGHHENGCESKCEICGKCTNKDCTKAECVDKCQGHTYGTDMIFKTDDTEVTEKASLLFSEWLSGENCAKLENGLIADVWKIANYKLAAGEFTIYAEEAVEVEFFLIYGYSASACDISDRIIVTLNGETITAGGEVVKDTSGKINSVVLAKLTLNKGVNTITLKITNTIPNMDSFGFRLATSQAE